MENILEKPRKIPGNLKKLHDGHCRNSLFEYFGVIVACLCLFFIMPNIDQMMSRSYHMWFIPTATTQAKVLESKTETDFLNNFLNKSGKNNSRKTYEAITITFKDGAKEIVTTYHSNDKKRQTGEILPVKYSTWFPSVVVPEDEYLTNGIIVLFLIIQYLFLFMAIFFGRKFIHYFREYRQWGVVLRKGEALPATTIRKCAKEAPLSDDRLRFTDYIREFSYKAGNEEKRIAYKITTTENALNNYYCHDIFISTAPNNGLNWNFWGKVPASPKDRLFFEEDEAWVFYHPQYPNCPILYVKDMELYL